MPASPPPPLTARSKQTLTPLSFADISLRFTTDPVVKRTWGARKGVIHVFADDDDPEGAVSFDFGTFAGDLYWDLSWDGKGQVLDKPAVRTLIRWRAEKGSTFRYVDEGEDNDGTVEILSFLEQRVHGQPSLYSATMRLHTKALFRFLGDTYTGD